MWCLHLHELYDVIAMSVFYDSNHTYVQSKMTYFSQSTE